MIINKESEKRFNGWFSRRFPNHSGSILESSLRDILMEAYKLGSKENIDLHYRKIILKFIEMSKNGKINQESMIDFLEKHMPVADDTYTDTK